MDWSLYRCGRSGHLTYAPDEAQVREQMHARTPSGELWQCLRCGSYVSGEPQGTGPAAEAPVVRRDKEIRGDVILKLFAIERGFRVLLFGVVAYGLWRFASARLTLTQAFNKDLPIVRSLFGQLGFTVNSSLVHELRSLLHVSSSKLTLIAVGLTALAVLSGVEAFALWQARRWGEYFAMIVTSLGVPVEIYELTDSITVTKVILFVLNLLLVVYLVYSRRLFGARGGKEAYEARLRAESVIDEAAKAAAGQGSQAIGATAAPPVGQADLMRAPAAAPVPPGTAPPQTPATQPLGGPRHASVTVPFDRRRVAEAKHAAPPESPPPQSPPAETPETTRHP